MNCTSRVVSALLFAAGTLVSIAAPAFAQEDESCPDYSCGCGKQQALRERVKAGFEIGEMSPGPYASREAMSDTDVISCDLSIDITPPSLDITGVNIMRVRSKVNGLTQFTIALRTNYTVTGATINGTTPVTVPSPGGNSYLRTITLDRAYNANEEFILRIPYTGTSVSRGFGSIQFGTQPSSSNPIVASLSEAYYAATWWPCKDGDVFVAGDNSDKFTMRMSITAPDTLTSVSNGPLQSVTTPAAGRKKYTYSTSYPVSTYLVMFSSSVYNSWSTTYTYTPDEGGPDRTMPLNFYVYPGSDTPANRAAWEKVGQMMDAYRPFYGLYPFINEQYGIYQFPFGGGMEHQTLTGQGTFNESVTAHELGHQWWGDNVTCKTWNHIWLNEGFATYTEAIWAQYKPGSAGESALFAAMASRKPGNPGDSVYVVPVNDMNRIFSSAYTYNKGAWVLHQLRHMLGDTTFFNGMKEFRARMEGSAATTEDFNAAMSSIAGRDLTNYFEQWVYGIGAPNYAYGYQNVSINGQNYLRLSLRQTHNSTWPGRGTPGDAFAMPVDIRIDTPAGSSTAAVNNTSRTQHFVIPVSAAATGLAVDEFNWILSYDKTAETYVNGPAKIVQASPMPGATVAFDAAPSQARVIFSENVNSAGTAYQVMRGTTPVSFSHSYSASTFTTTLNFGGPLAPGTYSVRVDPAITTVAAGIALDGEYPGTSLVGGTGLPSGNGLAGGAALYTFTVQPAPCYADFNDDGGIDGADIDAFFSAWSQGMGIADVNDDGGVDGSDVATFFIAWQNGSCG